MLLPKIHFWKGDWVLASVSTQFEIFLILSCFLRSQVWRRWDRSFDKCFCRILESCYRVLKICYLFGSQLIWQCHDICIQSSKMAEEDFSKKSVVAGHKILISKRGWQVNFLKGLLAIFEENRTLYICSIINNYKHAS